MALCLNFSNISNLTYLKDYNETIQAIREGMELLKEGEMSEFLSFFAIANSHR
jgi:hypothetical protein